METDLQMDKRARLVLRTGEGAAGRLSVGVAAPQLSGGSLER